MNRRLQRKKLGLKTLRRAGPLLRLALKNHQLHCTGQVAVEEGACLRQTDLGFDLAVQAAQAGPLSYLEAEVAEVIHHSVCNQSISRERNSCFWRLVYVWIRPVIPQA